jgi:glycosyltransferase involved in cell wall biosynthesis
MDAFSAWMIRYVKRRGQPYDVVHANFWMSGLVAAELKKALGVPFVVTFHALGRVRRHFQGSDDGFPDERFAIEDRVVAEADQVIAECPQDEEDLIRLYNADPGRISIVPCGFDPAEFAPMSRPMARLSLDLDPAERIILQLGRMVPRKGVDNVIRGLARLERDHGLPARLLVVGGESREPDEEASPEVARLRQVACEEGVADRVVFVGRRDREELKFYFNAADIFVTTPWYEPFGITPLEAMACGTPVIGADVGGIRFSVLNGVTGFLVPAEDPAALAARAAELLRDPQRMKEMGRNGIQRVQAQFTWPKVTRSISAFYEQVLGVRMPRRRVRIAVAA